MVLQFTLPSQLPGGTGFSHRDHGMSQSISQTPHSTVLVGGPLLLSRQSPSSAQSYAKSCPVAIEQARKQRLMGSHSGLDLATCCCLGELILRGLDPVVASLHPGLPVEEKQLGACDPFLNSPHNSLLRKEKMNGTLRHLGKVMLDSFLIRERRLVGQAGAFICSLCGCIAWCRVGRLCKPGFIYSLISYKATMW